MPTLVLSNRFQRELKRLLKHNKRLNPQVSKVLKFLISDISHPSLRLHKLSGQGNWSISVTRNIRIIAHLEKDRIYLLRIGTHDEVY